MGDSLLLPLCFFFSSRRRHTRCSRDWSSDVCSSDLIPLTVIGRCQQFVFRRLGEDQIVARLSHIAATEKLKVDAEAMSLIARTAQGSMRDAVGLLDQLVPLAEGPISLEAARSLLGIADPRLLDGLLADVLAGRAAEALEELNRVYAAGAELRQVVRGLMEGSRDRLLAAGSAQGHATPRPLAAGVGAPLPPPRAGPPPPAAAL